MKVPLARFTAFAAVLLTIPALAEDFRTEQGREYIGVTVSRVEPDGVILVSKTGVVKVYFAELPKEVQERYHYQPEQAATFARQDAERQRAIQAKILADQRAKTEQMQAEIRARAQSKGETRPDKMLLSPTSGMTLYPGRVSAAAVLENPFSMRGFIFELDDVTDYRKREVAEGVYRVELWAGSDGALVAELTAEQVQSVGKWKRIYARVKPQERYTNFIPITIIGTGVRHEGLSPTPIFYWK